MEKLSAESQLQEGGVWLRPQVQRLNVAAATAVGIKTGSTEDSFTPTNDWPAGVVPTKN
jgi:hypothetical protein